MHDLPSDVVSKVEQKPELENASEGNTFQFESTHLISAKPNDSVQLGS